MKLWDSTSQRQPDENEALVPFSGQMLNELFGERVKFPRKMSGNLQDFCFMGRLWTQIE